MDFGDFVTFPAYYYKWKTSFPKLKECVLLCLCQSPKYLANHAIGHGNDGSDDNEGNDNVENQQSVDATNANDGKEGTADSSLGVDANLNTL